MCSAPAHVCVTPESGHWDSAVRCLLCAKSGHSDRCGKCGRLQRLPLRPGACDDAALGAGPNTLNFAFCSSFNEA